MKKLLIAAVLISLMVPSFALAADITMGNEIPSILKETQCLAIPARDVAASTTVTVDDRSFYVTTVSAITMTLPALASIPLGKEYTFCKKGNIAGTAAVTLDGNASEVIMNGSGAEATTNTQIDASGDCLTIQAASDVWLIVGQELQ